eukprot:CAMPEP_0174237838 /NCGR_PEP_ID=MMETSP0417-20130205/9428_1 /TAXON_ID=242541 /ORGANISM="Mayorella sp, Strain BSH-02190019" /LENGTH=437 /DNA_ID=CAMNT_0015316625 /DNA_START=77 /DNA_END=1388 /DNA_ORIENTATION=-
MTSASPSSSLRGYPSSASTASSPSLSPLLTASSSPAGSVPTHAAIQQAARLEQLVASATDLDQPLSYEFTRKLFLELNKQLKEEQKQQQAYQSLLASLEEGSKETLGEGTAESGDESSLERSVAETQRELEELVAEEYELQEELKQLEAKRAVTARQHALLQRESERLDDLERMHWQWYNQVEEENTRVLEQREAVRSAISCAADQLEHLRRTNVYNDAFLISQDGHFGTINGFRLGRLQTHAVDWNHINAAWGQAALLLVTMARKLRFKFERYRLLPMGSFTKVQRLDNGAVFDLHSSSDISSRLIWYRHFDSAMVGFLRCLYELAMHASSRDLHFKIPYPIEDDRVGGMSIRIGQGNDQAWTKALKYMLTDLKFLLAWLSKVIDTSPFEDDRVGGMSIHIGQGNDQPWTKALKYAHQPRSFFGLAWLGLAWLGLA